ncbi:MAG TPA: NAD(P)-binding domain-containing protein [Devosia sp.]|nr:NAD(P)-binding domain-containing protein [Devosia sp.]
MSLNFGIIGYGEVGQIFARELLANGAGSVTVYDRLFGQPVTEARIKKAGEIGVRVANSAEDAIRGADFIISAVTADQAKAVAVTASAFLQPGQIFLDVNSASPDTKIESSKIVDATGANFVEGAVMATVPGPNLAVPMLTGGAKAAYAASVLNPLGMDLTPVSETTGRASATKLCRSIMIKGIEALIIQCKESCEKWGVEEEVFASLTKSYPGMDWKKLAVQMRGRVREHGVRRSAEMREAGQMVAALGMDESLCSGIADVQASFAGK